MIPLKITFASADRNGQAIPNADIGQVYFESGTVYFTDTAGVNGLAGLLKHFITYGTLDQLQPASVQITGFDYGSPEIYATPAALLSGDTNGLADIYYRWNGSYTQLTNGDAASSNGQYVQGVSGVTQGGVAFESTATNLLGAGGDTNGVSDIYFRAFSTGGAFAAPVRLSVATGGGEANGASFNLEAADYQPFLIFGTNATNLLGDGHGGLMWKDIGAGTLARASATTDGAPIDGVLKGDISASGRFVVFDSDSSSAVGGDTNGVRDVFLKDMQTGQLTRVSTNSDGSQLDFATANAAVSADGRYVAFEGAPGGGPSQIYVKDTTTGELARVTNTPDGQAAPGASHIVDFSGGQLLFRSDAGGMIAGLDAGGLYLANIGDGYVTRSGMQAPASTTFTMPAGIDDLSLSQGGYNVTGNELDNVFSVGSGNTIDGAGGDDIFRIGRAAVTATGGAGADTYVLDANPYAPSTITDFKIGEDELDLSAALASYRGTDPVGEGYVRFDSDGAGGTKVYVDRDGPSGSGIPIQMVTLKNVPVSSVTFANVTDRHDASGDHEAVISSSIRGAGSNSTGVIVNEFFLATHPEGDAQSGSLYLTAPDGIDDFTAAGHAVITDGVFTPTTFTTTEGNRIAFTGFDTSSGQLTYTYTLLTSQYHPYTNGSADVYMRQAINLQLTDRDGDVGVGTITASIQDAWPSLGTDIDLVPQGSATSTGNVIRGVGEADTAQYGDGHDFIPLEGGKIVRLEVVGGTRDESFDANGNLEVTGQYGTLSLNRNGDYTYALNSNVPAGVTDKFRYWMQDGDARPLQDYAGIEFRITQPGSTGGGGTTTPSDEGHIAFSTSSSTGAEGNSGPSPITFTLHRGGTGAGAATVNWAVTGSGDHPADAADFAGGVLPSGTISFADGETNKTLVINAAGDTTLEPNETFTVTLSNATGAGYIAPPYLSAIGTIGNDDAAPASAGQVYTSPGPGSTVTGGSGDDTINASVGPDQLTGGAGADRFVWANEPWSPATVTDFAVGSDRIDLSALFQKAGYTGADPVADKYISLLTDSAGTKVLFDHDGVASGQQWPNYIINLPGVTGPVTWAQLSGGPAPAGPSEFSLGPSGPFYQPEGNSGTTAYSFLISRSGSTAQAGSVSWGVNLAGHTATASDFSGGVAPAGGTVSFAPGETSKTITLYVAGDTTVEGDETFGVYIANPQGGALAANASSLMATIKNDDDGTPPSSNPGQDLYAYNPGSTVTGGSGDDTIHGSQSSDLLTGGAGADKFTWAKEPWSPATITDFAVGTDRLDFSALFQASGYTGSDPVADHYVSLVAQGADTLVLFDRDGSGAAQQYGNYVLKLQGVAAQGLTWSQLAGAPASPPGPQLAIRPIEPTHAEGNSGTVAFSYAVERTGPSDGTSTVHWTVTGSGAHPADAGDFGGTLPSGVLTFGQGETYKAVSFTVTGDTEVESDEGLTITLTDAVGAVIGTATAQGTITNDDTPPAPGQPGATLSGGDTPATLTGGAGDDTITAGHSADTITGGDGADTLAFKFLPWQGSTVTDFKVGVDRIDFSQLFQANGYTGTDPEADGHITYKSAGGLQIYFDPDQPGSGEWPYLITTLQGVPANTYDWADLTRTGAPPPPPPSGASGEVLTSDQYGDTLVGGPGDDTLVAGRGPDQLTGGGGGDHFVYRDLPWNAGRITDFDPYVDKLDVSALFDAHPGGALTAVGNRQGGVDYYFDPDGSSGADYAYKIVTIDGLTPGTYGSANWLIE